MSFHTAGKNIASGEVSLETDKCKKQKTKHKQNKNS